MQVKMASERLEDLKFFHKVCLKEHGRALRNLEEYLKKIAMIWKVIQENEVVDLKLYGSAATDFSQMGEVLRKFNIEVELCSTTDGAPYRLTECVTDPAINLNLSSSAFKTPASEKLGIDDFIDFDIAQSISSKHVQNYEGDCIITFVKDAKNKLVYITDISEPYEPIDLTKYFKATPKRLSRVPNFGVVFGYFFDKYMFRAVRSGTEVQASEEVSIYLMDVGELTNVPVENDYLYDLPVKYQQIPPQAILCRLLQVTGYTEASPEKFLEQNQYVKQKFRILNCNNNVFDIEMMPIRKVQSIEQKVSFNENVMLNPFQKLRCELPNDIAGPSNSDEIDHNYSMNQFNEPSSISNVNGDRQTRNIECFSNTSANHSGVTDEQRKILYEEPLGTDNAMEAVMGYNPQDDKRICPFYDKRINGCFKGPRCRLEHVEKLKDGWTRDRDTFKLTNRGAPAYPKVGSTIRIVPTHIVNYDKFYAQIPNQDENYPSLKEFIIDMNKTETEGRYRPLTKLPSEHELVIAKYIDGRWYRCRVLSVIDEDNIKVFYVDYGNCTTVSLQSIRVWDELFDYYPFQAYLCKLDNIEKATRFSAEATHFVQQIMLNKMLTANVTNILSELCLTVLDTNGVDVGRSLCEMKYATPKEVTRISTKQRFLPA